MKHPTNNLKPVVRIGAALLSAQLLLACSTGSLTSSTSSSDDSGTTSDTTSETTTAFPSGLAVTSPLDASSDSTSTSVSAGKSLRRVHKSGSAGRYVATTAIISELISGVAPICGFDPSLFLEQDTDADCYGPRLAYLAHPDAASSATPGYDGELPPHDLGLWSDTDTATGNACSAAELNARMNGVEKKSLAALESVADLICVTIKNGLSLPSNSTQDLTAEMTAEGIADTTFAGASITHSNATGTDVWTYDIDMTYTVTGTPHHVVVALKHIPGASAAEYQGRLTFRVNDSMTGGNCSGADVTNNVSLLYNSASSTDMNFEVRQGQFCGADIDGAVDGLIDPSNKATSTNLNGWGNNFSVLTADFDPSIMAGNFSYAWQAGPQDAATRVFNVVTSLDATTTLPIGSALFGFGADVDGADGSIDGFICNWAGANNSHTTQDYAQLQTVELDPATKTFVPTASSIGYAVTNACEYDGTGSFQIDTDADGVADSDPTLPIANDLQSLVDADLNGLFDEVEATGFVLPVPPANI